jgi:hypothetical protein
MRFTVLDSAFPSTNSWKTRRTTAALRVSMAIHPASACLFSPCVQSQRAWIDTRTWLLRIHRVRFYQKMKRHGIVSSRENGSGSFISGYEYLCEIRRTLHVHLDLLIF